MKTNLEPSKLTWSWTGWLWGVQVVTGDSQEEVMIFRYRQTDRHTLHHNIYIIIIVILISNCAPHGHLYCFTCSSQTIITMQGCVDQRSTCDQQHSGRRAKKRKSLELHKLSKSTSKSQIESRLRRVFPHLGLGDSHWVSPISGKASSQEILGFLGLSPIQVVEWSGVLDSTDLDLDCQREVLFF